MTYDFLVVWYALGWVALLLNAKHFGWLAVPDIFLSWLLPPPMIVAILLLMASDGDWIIWRRP